jgi:peptide/nickel transport system substrate-binding protein
MAGVAALTPLLAACGGATVAPGASSVGAGTSRLTVALPGMMIESLNPYAHSTGQLYPTWKHIGQPLVEWDWKQRALTPVLAESWTAEDKNTWVFKLKQGVKFNDGSDFTSADVVHSYTRMVKDQDSKQGSTLSGVDSMDAPDPYTVKLHTKQPDGPFVFRLTQRSIFSKAAYDKLGAEEADKKSVGTGPYKLKEWVAGQRFVVEKNPSYSLDIQKPTVDEVVFRNIPEAEAAITALLNGEVDQISNVPSESASRLTGKVRAASARDITILFLGMNSALVKQFADKRVRQAVNYAIDREAIVQGVLKGDGYPLDAPIGPDQYGYSQDIQPKYTHDPAKAKQLLADAGYPNGFNVDLQVFLDQYPKIKDIGQVLAQQLADVGIKANLLTPDQTSGVNAIEAGKAGFYTNGRGSVVDPSEYLLQYFRTGVTKRLAYSNPEVDKALDAQAAEFDASKRLPLLTKAMSMLMEEAPMAWLFQYKGIAGVSNRFDYTPNPDEFVYAWDFKLRPS